MALITYTGGAESTSLITVEWMENYLETIVPGGTLRTSWTSLETTQKEHYLEMAAVLMNWLPLRGTKSYRNQRLAFPRTCQDTPAVVPENAMKAQAIICYEVSASTMDAAFGSSPPSTAASQQVTSFTFGNLSGTVSDSAAAALGTSSVVSLLSSSCYQAYMLLYPYIVQIRGASIKTTSELAFDAQSLLTTTTA